MTVSVRTRARRRRTPAPPSAADLVDPTDTTKGNTVSTPPNLRRRWAADERGEGVISTGIAVLIMALLGAAMWFTFSGVFSDASQSIKDNVECTTSNSCTDTTGGGGGTGG